MARILVIDDVPGVRQSIVSILNRAGYEVEAVESGDEAVARAESFPADVVVTDVLMPGLDGVETIELLKRKIPDAKFVAVSGGGSLVHTDEILKLASHMADAILAKPFGNEELIETIQGVMGDK